MKKNTNAVRYTARGAIVAALYVVLTAISAAAGLSSGVIQLRISEALCILPIFMPEAVPGLFIGCLISNILVSNGVIWDIIFGSIATLIGALGAYAMRGLPNKLSWLATLPTVLANAAIVPPVLIFAYGAEDAYWFILLTVTLGELLSATLLGSGAIYVIRKSKISL